MSVTPARRRRGLDDIDGEDESRIPSSQASRGSKRTRHEDGHPGTVDDGEFSEDAENEYQETIDAPLLPDNFRRSPKNQQHNALDFDLRNEPGARYQPGSIVRVTLRNFVTYTSAEFIPGPYLNMVIGPNGTGKSTLVCAICIGLGWETAHLGRAKDLGEFVKHGERHGTIEIELARDDSRQQHNPVVTAKISKDGNKIQFAINGKNTSKKAVKDLARSFSIQVDNLCQFLPQDRVVEFANLSAERLLDETQRAAAPDYMIEWHTRLKEMRKDQLAKISAKEEAAETLRNMHVRQNAQLTDYERQRERGDVRQRKEAFEKLRPVAVYTVRKAEHSQAVRERKIAEKELRGLERETEPHLQQLQLKQNYVDTVERVKNQRARLVQRAHETVSEIKSRHDAINEQITEAHVEVEAERGAVKTTKQSIPQLQQQVRQIKNLIDEGGPADFDPAAYNEKLRTFRRDLQTKESEKQEVEAQMSTTAQQVRHKNGLVKQLEKEKYELKSQAGQQISKLRSVSRNGDAARAWDWIQLNRDKFQCEVYGPPIVECNVRDQQFASAVESALNLSEMTAFTVTCQEDFKMLQEHLYGTLRLSDVSIRSSITPLSDFQAPCSKEQLTALGLESWILELIEGPGPVLAMLCENRNIHRMGFTSHDVSNQQYDELAKSPISNFVTSRQTYQRTSRAEYGPDATSTRVNPLRQARFFTNTTVDRSVEQQLDAKMREHKREAQILMSEYNELKTKIPAINQDLAQLTHERDAAQKEKDTKQRELAVFNALPTRLQAAESKLQDAQQQVAGSRERQITIFERAEKLSIAKGQAAIDFANSLSSLQSLAMQSLEAAIASTEAVSDLDQLKSRRSETLALLEAKRTQVQHCRQRIEECKAAAIKIQQQIQDLGTLNDSESEVYHLLLGDAEDTDTHPAWTVEQVDAEIESLQSRLEMTAGGGSRNVIQEFETRAQKIQEREREVASIQMEVAHIESKINEVREQWEPQLEALVAQISEAFSDNFARIQCSGEVIVFKDENEFEKWAIHIMVKFRESDPLTRLSAQRQSGGERAVSTIFYLMALQSLARAPFRVVDEINQGMDPRNERLVHSRMVEIACGVVDDSELATDRSTGHSQYFLITPKLLSGLRYHPRMRVLSIFSGDYVPSAKAERDFEALARRAIEVRKSALGAA